ncbi:MAG: MarR family transcriptional regulator [Methylibium sp.]|nr:MarR family transcriptional regulator [Methylibium sp.]
MVTNRSPSRPLLDSAARATARRPVRRARSTPAPAGPALALDAQLCFALYSASLAMTKRYRPMLGSLGLTYPQYLVMLALWEHDGSSVSSLGERLFLDSGTLTPLLKPLQAAGLLTRERATDDERRVVVTLTPAGRTLRRRALGVPAALAEATASSPGELAALTATLQQLRAALHDDTEVSAAA